MSTHSNGYAHGIHFMGRDSFIRVISLFHTNDITRLYAWHAVCVYLSRLGSTHCVWRDSFTCVIFLIHTCDMTHSYVWQDSFIRVIYLIRMCDMNEHSFICVTWMNTHPYAWHEWGLIDMCDMTYACMLLPSRVGGAPSQQPPRFSIDYIYCFPDAYTYARYRYWIY